MARDLETELARLWRKARRRVALLESRDRRSADPMTFSRAERLALIWDRTRARVLLWLRRAWR
ncbi:MAG: hypothetical protein ACR2F8_01580 [Caulobacteraceae bacterium]